MKIFEKIDFLFSSLYSVLSAIFGGNFMQMREYASPRKIGKEQCRKNTTLVLKGQV
jgi:hypothetical protein